MVRPALPRAADAKKGAASPPRPDDRNAGGPYAAGPNEAVSILKPGPMVEERLIFLM
jgi:hypothetical protein